MGDGAFGALVGVDIRRLRGHVARGAVFTLAALVLFTVLGRGDRETVASVLLGTSVYYLLWPPLAAIVDRLEGGMELLASLPLRAETVARARLTGIAIAVLPIALHAAGAFVLFVGPALGVQPSPGPTGAVFALAWAVSVGIGAVGAGAVIRWGVEAMGRWPVVVTGLGLLLFVLLGERYGARLADLASDLVAQAGVPLALGGVVAAAALACTGLGYGLIRSGLERFRPERGRLRW